MRIKLCSTLRSPLPYTNIPGNGHEMLHNANKGFRQCGLNDTTFASTSTKRHCSPLSADHLHQEMNWAQVM